MTVTQDLDIWTLIVNASFVVKVVMFLLLAVSFMSWMFIFQKWFSIRRANAQTDKFEREFWSGNDLNTLAETLNTDDITKHLYTVGQPDPDLIIRTSGEQRMSNFLLWQSAYSEFYFCEAYWPAFREVDFLRALRSYADRHRRRGA